MINVFINTNVGAINAHRNLAANNNALNKSMEKLSSGYRINRAADDADGLAISEKMRFQINTLQQYQRNAQDGISMVQTFEGALTEVHSMLQRMNTLATQAANGTYNTDDLAAASAEMHQLVAEIISIAANTTFNGKDLISGSGTVAIIQVGKDANTRITISAAHMS